MTQIFISSEELRSLTHATYGSSRYCDVYKLPADLQALITSVESERECSRHTVYKETLFLRGEFLTSDGIEHSFEVCVGEIPGPTDAEGNEISDDDCEDPDVHYESMADEMRACIELGNCSVYFGVRS